MIDQKYVKKVKTVRPPTLGWGPSTLTSAPLSSSTPMADSCPPSMWSAPRCAEDKTYYRSTVDQIPLPCLCWLLWGLPPVFFQPFCPCDKGSPPLFNGQGALCNVIWKQLRCKLITKLNLNSLFVAKLIAPSIWSLCDYCLSNFELSVFTSSNSRGVLTSMISSYWVASPAR